MKSFYLALFLTLSLHSVTCFDMGGQYADQFAGTWMNQYAGSFLKNTPGTTPGQGAPAAASTPETPASTSTPAAPKSATDSTLKEAEGFEDSSADSVFSDLACSDAMDKTNTAIAQLTRAVSMANDKWGIYGYAQKLSKTSEIINSDCEITNLKLVNLGRTGLNRTQDAACKMFLQLVRQTIVSPPTEIGPPTDYVALLNFSKRTLDLSRSLGKRCEVSLIDKTEEVPPVVSPVSIYDDDLNLEDLLADDLDEDNGFGGSIIEADLVQPSKLPNKAKL